MSQPLRGVVRYPFQSVRPPRKSSGDSGGEFELSQDVGREHSADTHLAVVCRLR